MAAIVENVTLASPLADAEYAHMASSSRIDGLLGTLSELSGWTIALTLLALMVAYDQCQCFSIPLLCTRQLTISQAAIYGRKVRFLVRHGRFPSSAHSSNL